MFKKYRLGIDMGATSLGWCMLELDENSKPNNVINMGVRIFPDGRDAKKKEPLSVARRVFRGQRRNHDRFLQRRTQLISYLITIGFLPQNKTERDQIFLIDPYYLRSKALNDPLSPGEFSRAIIHLAKRRGFKSNRKIMSDKTTAYTTAINNLEHDLKETNSRTLGEYLWQKQQELPLNQHHLKKPIKFRYEINTEEPNPIFPLREMVEHEFDTLWNKQAALNSIYKEEYKAQIRKIIFDQRPLQPQPKGKCQLLPEYKRAPKAHPLFQEFRILQDLNSLSAINVFDNSPIELSDEQYRVVYNILSTSKEASFTKLRKSIFGKEANDYKFNFETAERKKLLGDLTYHEIHKKGNEDIAEIWDTWNLQKKSSVIEILVSDMDDDLVMSKLSDLDVNPDISYRLMDIHLPCDYCHLSIEALQRVLPFMRDRYKFNEACQMAGFSHSLEYNGELYQDGNLPYYGKLLKRETMDLNRKSGDPDADANGKINNPTVHIALNQLRKLINALVKKYGPPNEIVLELGKEIKLGKKEKERLQKRIRENEKVNEEINNILSNNNIYTNHDNRLRTKLWLELGSNELDHRCIYTGKQISFTDLFSSRIEIDHILPKSRTYDDATSNKILCYREANRYKAERSPYEAFGLSSDGYKWEDIVSRASNLPSNKAWRFQTDAMDRFQDKEELLARMLNDTRYMSRVAMKYMYYVCGDKKVWSVTGRHTGMIRAKWGLNSILGDADSKDRSDHRHHAIDAFVIAMTSHSMIKKMANNIENSREKFIENLDLPYPGFSHEDFAKKVQSIVTSYKPDQINPEKLKGNKQTGGGLLQDTAYSFIGIDPDNSKQNLYSVKKAVTEINKENIDSIASPEIRKELTALAERINSKEFPAAIKEWSKIRNVKKVKVVLSKNPANMIPIKNGQGRVFKVLPSYENLFSDIYIPDPASKNPKWKIEIINSYNAHQNGFLPLWKKNHPKGKKVMRLFKNDIIALDNEQGERELLRVRKMTNGNVYLRKINIAKKDKKFEDIGEQYSPNKLQARRARKAGIDIIGRVYDPIVRENE